MKKGFASMTIIYTFLIVFIMALLSLLAIFSQKSRLVDSITIEAKDQILNYTNTTEEFSLGPNFPYTGNYQRFIVPQDGYYKIEVWGAQGGSAAYSSWEYAGGEGGYTSGKIYLTQGEQLYIYVGGMGESVSGTTTFTKTPNGNGYNGGTVGTYRSGTTTNDGAKSGGGGATDIRLVSGSWDNANSLNSRIMVAGGGGGASSHSLDGISRSGAGGLGGNLIGGTAQYASLTCYAYGTGGTQTTGGYSIVGQEDNGPREGTGTFGKGCVSTPSTAISGGAGGYYGGGEGWHSSAGGGSSFISGYAGVSAIIEGSTREPREHTTTYINSNNESVEIMNTLHYSEKYFVDGEMQAGVNTGNGRATITYLGSILPRINTALNNVRYIKDCINGSSANAGNHWVEFQAIVNGTNVAKGKVGILYNSSNAPMTQPTSAHPFSAVTDGNINASIYAEGYDTGKCFVIDLGQEYNLDEVAVWHYWGDGRTYYDNITSVAGTDGIYRIVISTTEPETFQGKRISAY